MEELGREELAVYQNLMDADCDTELIERFFVLQSQGKIKEQLSLLSCHRQGLLQKVRMHQKRLDCLDYLIYKMKKSCSHKDELLPCGKENKP